MNAYSYLSWFTEKNRKAQSAILPPEGILLFPSLSRSPNAVNYSHLSFCLSHSASPCILLLPWSSCFSEMVAAALEMKRVMGAGDMLSSLLFFPVV